MILVIDNYDSFTYNLVQMLSEQGAELEVVRNDLLSADEILERAPAGVLVSPGPGRPEDAGVTLELLARRPPIPILGVCLGHQALGASFGARVERSPVLMHGKTSPVRHDGSGVFRGLPDPFEATRYHSLAVPEASLPDELVATAWSDDGVLMGLSHRRLPWWGVQFHPESILTRSGPALLANFLELAGARRRVVESAASGAAP